jgi:trehalose/maltose hydrolase-like predicted phosphorylase
MPGTLAPALDFYEPRCAHGSSLSPGIHAALNARAGRLERALELFRLAARLDLDDITGTTAGGLHLGTMGGVWQCLAHGFLGLQAVGDQLAVDPRLPAAWERLGLRFRFRGAPVRITVSHDDVTLSCPEPLRVRVPNSVQVRCEPADAPISIERSTP